MSEKLTAEERAEAKAAKKNLATILGMLVQVEGATSKQVAATTGLPAGEVAKVLQALVKDGKAVAEKPGGAKSAAVYSLLPEAMPEPGAPAERRIRKDGEHARPRGQLSAEVHAMLAGRPNEDLGATAIGKFLGASVGAVANALEKMASDPASGVKATQEKPRRFAYTG